MKNDVPAYDWGYTAPSAKANGGFVRLQFGSYDPFDLTPEEAAVLAAQMMTIAVDIRQGQQGRVGRAEPGKRFGLPIGSSVSLTLPATSRRSGGRKKP